MTDQGTTPIDFSTGAPVAGRFPERWIHGAVSPKRDTGPEIQVHAYDEHTYLLRQSKSVTYEAPFLYLFFGNERALLMDTGATKDPARFPLRDTVDALVDGWLEAHPRDAYPLVVAHTHAHGDHVAGDGQFVDRPLTTVVGTDLDAVRDFFGLTGWPDQVVAFDLGGRVLEVTGCPGHHATSVAVFDPWTGFLLTGDSVYPGRLYAFDFPTFVASAEHLVDFAAARPVTHVMGCHIEMRRTPRRDYPLGALYQPDEPPLQMTVAQLVAVRDAARGVADKPGVHRFDDFVIYQGPCTSAIPGMVLRGLGYRMRNAVRAVAGGRSGRSA
ncbi:MAG TPA: MBL fold metallo-hydrolase [Micromonosporaceae bacterium]|nr:MBL fold metallo-hydrolase [Micromonosporaceae bacterium]